MNLRKAYAPHPEHNGNLNPGMAMKTSSILSLAAGLPFLLCLKATAQDVLLFPEPPKTMESRLNK